MGAREPGRPAQKALGSAVQPLIVGKAGAVSTSSTVDRIADWETTEAVGAKAEAEARRVVMMANFIVDAVACKD